MAAVLGVDAAWTAKNASGYALIQKSGGGWRLSAAAPDLPAFARECGLAGAGPGMDGAIDCAKHVLGRLPNLIAVDMPLSKKEIVGRRASDIGVSRRFGAAKCATHSPSAERPGKVSCAFRAACEKAGYALIVASGALPALSLAEVYPHPALLRLMGADERIPYKTGKSKIYWPQASASERLERVTRSLRAIAGALDNVIAGVQSGVAPLIADARSFAGLKPVEDMLDAIVCAWIGATILAGEAQPIGDEDSAIWIPDPLTPAALAGAA